MKIVSDDDGYLVMKVILWWTLSKDESYLVKKVSDNGGNLVMKVILWWNFSRDESHDSRRSDDRWRFACGNVFFAENRQCERQPNRREWSDALKKLSDWYFSKRRRKKSDMVGSGLPPVKKREHWKRPRSMHLVSLWLSPFHKQPFYQHICWTVLFFIKKSYLSPQRSKPPNFFWVLFFRYIYMS